MNNLAEHPLVTRVTGGRHGGGSTLTPYGEKVVALYRALESEYQAALDRLAANMHSSEHGDFAQFRQLLKRMSMRSSARNQFAGTCVRCARAMSITKCACAWTPITSWWR